jgi:hypothetical protein
MFNNPRPRRTPQAQSPAPKGQMRTLLCRKLISFTIAMETQHDLAHLQHIRGHGRLPRGDVATGLLVTETSPCTSSKWTA